MAEDKETQERIKKMAKADQEEYLAKAKSRHKGAAGAPEFKVAFHPPGPQEMKDMYT